MIERIIEWIEACEFDHDPELWKELIKEEVGELDEAYNLMCLFQESSSPADILDALGDLLWVTIGMIHNMGYDWEKVIKTIIESNNSKFCSTELEAQTSVTLYSKQGIGAYYKKVGDVYVIKRASDHKVLKGINYKKPDWSWVETT